MSKAKSKKAISLFATMQQAVNEVVARADDYARAKSDYECAKQIRAIARENLRQVVVKAAQSGFMIEPRASKGTFALALHQALKAAGFDGGTLDNTMVELRKMTGVCNTGNRGKKKSTTKTGPISGFTMNLSTAAKPDVVKNKVIALAEYLKAEYPNDEQMLRIAAYLIDVSDE